MLAVALLKVASHPTPPFSPTHRLVQAKIVSHGLSNLRYQRALLADFLQFREGMVQAVHTHSKGRYVMPIPSTINTKPQHFSLTPTSSPCQAPIQTNTNTTQKQTKTSGNQLKHHAFRTMLSSEHLVPLHNYIAIPASKKVGDSRCPKSK